MKKKWFRNASPMRIILGGYCLIILLGAFLLSTPLASNTGSWSDWTDCLFTATSATCVTGLIRFDTALHWNLFGQILILTMIQIGGVGFVTMVIWALILTKRKIGLTQRALMQNSISAPNLGGIVGMTRYILKGTFIFETAGAILLSFDFVPKFGWSKGIYYSIFHSISAFCNAGFDLMGTETGAFSSLAGLSTNWYVNIVIMLLVIIGGLGFFVWKDMAVNRFHFRKFRLQSKMVISISAVLLILGAVVFFILEGDGEMLQGMSTGDKVLASMFLSVTSRTAGFGTTDLSLMKEASVFFMVCLMLVGGSTGSTAGGIKTTTLWVLIISVMATFKRKKNIEAFGRRIDESITRTASCIFMSYLMLIITSTIIITAIEGLPALTVLYETTSAMATVGLTLGITSSLCTVSKLIITLLMLCGRVGSVTMMLAFSSEKRQLNSKLPIEDIQVG